MTMKEIAKLADVSQSTVSRILNGTANVSPEKKARVMELVRKTDFKPNLSARSLVSTRSQLFGVIFPDLMTPFFSEILTIVERISAQNGYNIIVCNSNGDEKREIEALASLKARQVDGVLVGVLSPESAILDQLRKKSVKSVVITQEHPGLDCIGVSHHHGGAIAARHFMDINIEHFVFLGPEHDEKYIGFRKELSDAGVDEGHIHIIEIENWWLRMLDQGYKNTLAYLKENRKKGKCGIFAVNDAFAYGAIHAAQELDIKIPQDLAIVGFDNTFLCENVKPMITSIAQPTEEIGRVGVEMLLKRIENDVKVEDVHIQLEPRLIRRETS